ncbi:MAG: bifunctional UDP-N-acetylglucosamine diphosphorylase/glucosamine-1-phosphate N-acetyltransferase GlmU [Alphaproteobacteria bacterium]|nr:bifunctional UDP-N-acetylglucosamine diphosphorylase/glucosamine-1-phosphate N-acetyltransferase GlmU [Alphaproteobacteria bacterium]
MTARDTAAVILAAGKGTRMKSALPKVLQPVAGLPMVCHVLAAVEPLDLAQCVVVIAPDMPEVKDAVAPHATAVQEARQGTADAVKAARPMLGGMTGGTILVLFGDTPLIHTETIRRMLAARAEGAAVAVLGFRAADPTGYGRLVLAPDGALDAIVEHHDATEAQKAIDLCNSGVMAVDAARLFPLLDRVGNDNAKKEYYLTDIVGLARADGLRCAVVEVAVDANEVMGVDSRAGLARAEAAWQARRRAVALDAGVTLQDPDTVWFSHDTVLGQDAVVGPNVVFETGVTVKDGATIKAFCHLDGVIVEEGAIVGPFARLRPGAVIGKGVHIGNFVEVKNAVMGEGAKANHLAYIGDADIGAGSNIGAGTITCNYDGFGKHKTVIGEAVFVGSNSTLVAPISIGDRAYIGAGSTVVENVSEDALAIGRGRQVEKPGRAKALRDKLADRKKQATKDKA